MIIASYNIHSCVGSDSKYDVNRVASTISALAADIVALQEVEVNKASQKTRLWSVVHEDDQPALLAAATGLLHSAFAPAVKSICTGTFREEHDTELAQAGHFGVAILSKHPILEQRVVTFKRYKKKTLRNALAVKVQPPSSEPIWFVCTHLGCHTGEEQLHQARELNEWMSALDDTVICCGDTNSPPWFAAISALTGDGFVDCGGERTFPAVGWPCCFWASCLPALLKLDYCVYRSSEWKCVETTVPKGGEDGILIKASDHRPLVSRFEKVVVGGGGMARV
mmetsp:Transcript_4511/g.8615  ORF Transcript_4511/g.8615 Transcript_4511/m.8615 type:complete len:281 (+) Transcript_4511:68-910(+)